MKLLFVIFTLFSHPALCGCNIKPLQKEIISQYQVPLPVKNAKGELGHAEVKKIVVSDHLMKLQNENFLVANFDLDIKWLKGKKETVRSIIVATVDTSTCKINGYVNKKK